MYPHSTTVSRGECVAVTAYAAYLWRQRELAALLGMPLIANPARLMRMRVVAFAGWGYRPSGLLASWGAALFGIPNWRLEDGFLRSVGMGRSEAPLSIVVDDLGIHYDANRPSRLEVLVRNPLSAQQTARALALIVAWRAARVSKYNRLREYSGHLPDKYVLVADQTFGDRSIRFGGASAASFRRMLQAALDENPNHTVLVKVHPGAVSGRGRGYFDLPALQGMPRVQVFAGDVHPVSLIEHADAVYAVTSQMGFEGLLWGKHVRTFGMPFYAGWGLTQDELPAPDRRKPVAIENLVHATLVDYPRYLDPETGKRCEPERLIEWMGLQRRQRERWPAEIFATGFARWKKPVVRDYFVGSKVHFVQATGRLPKNAALAVWGSSPVEGRLPDGTKILRVEDGFLRSVGLGADLVRPLSWVIDGLGIYYDSTQPSALEVLLQQTAFSQELIERARKIRERLVAEGLTKYNVGSGKWQRPGDGENSGEARRVILVTGQVESDAALAFGAPGIRTNTELLHAVRKSQPADYIIYKPHPEVVARVSGRGEVESHALEWCDEVVMDVPMGELLQSVDEVHVITSLAGFEALLREKAVTCHGHPFYAGWGLTKDMTVVPRRSRRLNIEELVAGALLLYPSYLSRITRKPTTAEQALDELLAWRDEEGAGMPSWRKLLRLAKNFGQNKK
jgi:capsular polysaccharide export protein